jgi:hypothetical protein
LAIVGNKKWKTISNQRLKNIDSLRALFYSKASRASLWQISHTIEPIPAFIA